jgi:purine-cytosine permease-like protein
MYYLPNSWAGAASDYYVYFPENTPKWKPFVLTFAGLTLAIGGLDLVGIGIASGVGSHPAWGNALGTSSGALIVECYKPLGDFGKFCAVIVALGVIANDIMGTYSAAIGCQIMGRWGQVLPRWVRDTMLFLTQPGANTLIARSGSLF